MPYRRGDEERRCPEPAKDSGRGAFTRDRARVLHCAALRRLAAKTQVLVAGESDIPRTRLTHTLEVAQVSREMGLALGADPDLVELAALAHDIGHPPFGHNGESALDALGASCGGFEGNAQSFRVLTRLEAKVHCEGDSVGLNLTRASLDAATKYPWPRTQASPKFGVYHDDRGVFDWMRRGAPGERRCLEAQIMDWADDVAYSVHDVEDAVVLGHLDLGMLRSPGEQEAVAATAQAWYAPDRDPEELRTALRGLVTLGVWPPHFDGSHSDLAALKAMTSALIGRFTLPAQAATRGRYGTGALSRYDADLVVPDHSRAEVAVMKGVAAHYVMQRPGAKAGYERQRTVVADLAAALMRREGADLEPWLRDWWSRAEDDADRLRVVIDQIASLTDVSILRWHREVCP